MHSGAVHLNEWFETHPFLKQMRRRLSVELAVCLLLFCGVFLAARYAGLASAGADAVLGKKKPVVFLDAGHGDFDPGKVSVDGSLEKDINLAIAKRLKWYLEQSDVEVVMSREDDRGLYDTSAGSRKMSDMKTAAPASRNPARICRQHPPEQLPPGGRIWRAGILLPEVREGETAGGNTAEALRLCAGRPEPQKSQTE